MIAIPSRANIVTASFSVSVREKGMIPECAKNRPNLRFGINVLWLLPDSGIRPTLQCLSRKASRQLVRFRTGKNPAVASRAPLGAQIQVARPSAKRVSDDRRDEPNRGKPTHSPDQQLCHRQAYPC